MGGGSVSVLHSWECNPFIAVHSFSASWIICRLYTRKMICIFVFLHISHSFPMAVIFHREQHKCDNIVLRPFSFFWLSPQFFFLSHSDCHKSHQIFYHSDEVAVLKNSKHLHKRHKNISLKHKMTKQHQRVNSMHYVFNSMHYVLNHGTLTEKWF